MSSERIVDVTAPVGASDGEVRRLAAAALGVLPSQLGRVEVVKRALDARKRRALSHHWRLRVELAEDGVAADPLLSWPEPPPLPSVAPQRSGDRPPIVVVGAGPAGLFCAYRLALAGLPVVLLEMGKIVEERKRDIARLLRDGTVDPASNLCFGEGGAGTFSDGKLYTRRKEPERTAQILETLAALGAPRQILWEARPHVGTDKLALLLRNLRALLAALGVELRFGATVDDLVIAEAEGRRRVRAVRLTSGEEVVASAVVLAIGHSARALYGRLAERDVALEAKAFAVGARVEHPQPLIDELQYGRREGHPDLPAASYSLAVDVNRRGVYSFCMCPGGMVVPTATEPDGICTNGMSASRRNTPWANSALVVTVETADFGRLPPLDPDDPDEVRALRHPVLLGSAFQRRLEHRAFLLGGGAQRAPAQRLDDFLARRASQTLPEVSYRPGVRSVLLDEALPGFLADSLRGAARLFEQRMRGFVTREATLIAVETRTSAPVRIVRDPERLESLSVDGLFPCGEGAGYAGGITSSALDGWRVAEALVECEPGFRSK